MTIVNALEHLPPEFADPFMRQWLCSCAVFPGLRFALTLQLGRRLAEALGRNDVPGENEAMDIFRLPWFREGRMPEDVRLELIGALEDKHLPLVRETIEEVMFNALDEEPVKGAPEDFKQSNSGWRRRFTGFLFSREPQNRQRDVIYRQFMLGDRPGQLDLVIDDWSRRIAGEGLAAWIDRRSLIAAALAVVVTGLAAAALPLFDTSEELAQISSETEAEITYFRDCELCPEMAVLPAGRFVMGSPADEPGRWDFEGPQHTVDVPEFSIGVHEVTFDQYDTFARATKRELPDDAGWGRGDRPVIDVSPQDARDYAAWLGETTGRECRLPSEAEWEYACRAGTTTRFAFGYEITTNVANFDRNSSSRAWETKPVMSYEPNAFGLYDMHGNVWEMVEDCWNVNYLGAPIDGRAWGSGDCNEVIFRGGSWDDGRNSARCAYRRYKEFYSQLDSSGFRVACSSSNSNTFR